MNQRKNGPPPAHAASPLRAQQSGRPHQPKHGVMQTKKPTALQPKTVGPSQVRTSAAAPPVYRPQPVPKVLQTKAAAHHQPAGRAGQAGAVAVAPPAYRPQPTPKVLQTKSASVRQSHSAQPKRVVQPKTVASSPSPVSPKAPPVYRPQTARAAVQAKSLQTKASTPAQLDTAKPHGRPLAVHERGHVLQRCASSAQTARHGAKPAPVSPVRGLIQPYIIEDTNTPGTYISDGARPGSHLNVSTMETLAEEIISNAPLNNVEKELVTDIVSKNPTWGKKQVVKHIRKQNLLSTNAFAVCHKIPYASVEKVVLAYINQGKSSQSDLQNLSNLMHAAEGMNHGVSNQWHSSVQSLGNAIASGKSSTIQSTSRILLNEFDGAPDNLYFGFATTNSSIGQSGDLHFNILSVGALPEAPTPRGADLLRLLNMCEGQLGLSFTTEIEWVGKWKGVGRWVMTSGTHGKKTTDTGMVLST